MKCLTNWNPLSFTEYTSLGDDYQKILSNNQSSNLILRTGWIFAKITGRVQDVALNVLFGIVKLTLSTTIAIYSIPAAAFNRTHNHHVLAKQGSRHIALALFYVIDILLSFANIANKYPSNLVKNIRDTLEIENMNEEIDTDMVQIIQGLSTCEKSFSQKLVDGNRRLIQEKQDLLEIHLRQEELIEIQKETIAELNRNSNH